MANMYEIIEYLCKQKGITGGKLCNDLGISRSTITELRKGRTQTLKIEKAIQISNYFGVSVGYLFGTEQKEKPAAKSGEQEVTYDDFTYALQSETWQLTESDKALLLSMAKQLNDARKQSNEQSS